jgi:class 3 adenylate cyclase
MVGAWLRSVGLERYEMAFRENAIDTDVLRELTDEDLEKLGVLLGDRRRLLRAIAELDTASAAAVPSAAVPSAPAASPTSGTVGESGEYRNVTVMFCDLVDPTGTAAAEEWRGLVGAYLEAASTAVTERGGKVVNKLGDDLIALFGYPVAQEDDLQRATQAACAIQRSLAELNRENDRDGNPRLAARIAIDSGPMVIDAAGATQEELEPSTVLTATRQRKIQGQLVTEGASSELRVPRAPRANGIVLARDDGHSMSYHQLIARAVDELDSNTGEARRALYERARQALLAKLRTNKPVLVLADINRERRALEEAISKVEADVARKPRTEPHELESAALPARTPDGDAVVSSAPPRRDRARPPLTNLPEDEWPAVLFSARDRLLSVRSSRRTQAASGSREVVGDVTDPGTPGTAGTKAARQPFGAPQYAEGREPYPDDFHPIDDGVRHRRRHELDQQDELPAQDTLDAPELEKEQTDQWAISRPNWSRPLPKLLIISGTTVTTLNDVRVMIERHLPVASRANEMWKYVSSQLRETALGGDTAEFCSVLEMALSIEGLECVLK